MTSKTARIATDKRSSTMLNPRSERRPKTHFVSRAATDSPHEGSFAGARIAEPFPAIELLTWPLSAICLAGQFNSNGDATADCSTNLEKCGKCNSGLTYPFCIYFGLSNAVDFRPVIIPFWVGAAVVIQFPAAKGPLMEKAFAAACFFSLLLPFTLFAPQSVGQSGASSIQEFFKSYFEETLKDEPE